jgi:NADPH:quinone reductase-like Zn-dependent oxidoreductase
MQAWTTTGHQIALAEVDQPIPAPDEVLIAVDAYSVNRGETFVIEQAADGWRPGKDIAGTVVRAAATGGPPLGTRVVGHPEQGGWAEQVAVPLSHLAALPNHVELATAAALPLAGLTALRVCRTLGFLGGRRLLLTGASGGVGHYVTELAAAQGARVTAIVGSPARGQRLRELGAYEVVGDLGETDGLFDVAIESVGGGSLAAMWPRLTDDALVLWMGQASLKRSTVDFFDWSGGSSATIRKFDYTAGEVSVADDLATLVRLVATGRLHPEIDTVRDWRETPEVLKALVAREIRGNAVLRVD